MKFKDARVGMRIRYNLKKVSYKGVITKVRQEKSQSTLKTARGSIVTSVYTNHIYVKPDNRKKEIDCAPRDIKDISLEELEADAAYKNYIIADRSSFVNLFHKLTKEFIKPETELTILTMRWCRPEMRSELKVG